MQYQQMGIDQVRPGVSRGLAPTNGLYSAWNWDKGQYDYFEAPAGNRPSYGSEIPPPPSQGALGSALGEDPDNSSHRMPMRAKYVGSGHLAMGEVVAVVEGVESASPWVGVVLALVIPSALLWLTVRLGDVIGRRDDEGVEF